MEMKVIRKVSFTNDFCNSSQNAYNTRRLTHIILFLTLKNPFTILPKKKRIVKINIPNNCFHRFRRSL